MLNVEFESDFQPGQKTSNGFSSNGAPSFGTQRSVSSGLIGWMVRKGLVKNEEAARLVLLVIIVVNFSIIGFIVYTSFVGPIAVSSSSNTPSTSHINPGLRGHRPQ